MYDDTSVTDFILLESGILELHLDTDELTNGETYIFKAQARNSFGLSTHSDELILTIGFKPE
jgi:hypothetical protein